MTARNPRLDPDNTLPKVKGWVSLTEAAELLGYSRQHGYRMAAAGKFKTLSRLGTGHIFCVAVSEVESMRTQKDGDEGVASVT